MSGMVFEARNEFLGHQVSTVFLFSFFAFWWTEFFHNSYTLACTTPNSLSEQEKIDRSTNCSQCTLWTATFHRPSFKITRIGGTLTRVSLNANQSFCTLTGLVNKLVLRGIKDSSRSVIIPHGDVLFSPFGHHLRVHIDASTQHRSYHLCHIDCQLGRLVDNGSLRSKLFKCYLHAVTAHCLTDELTGRAGTEEALSTLASLSVRSFLSLKKGGIDLLVLLARLTPRRQYYPRHLRVMQEVEWETLSALSQHDSFCTSVR